MGQNNQNDDFLSSWKEIAAYLKCGVRSCIRWEQKSGLPIHRVGDSPGSRVYAYKHELEDWLKQRKSDHEISKERSSRLKVSRKILLFLFPILISAAGIFFAVREQKAPGPFRLDKFNIITAEPDGPGRLRVWGNKSPHSYENIWGMISSKYNTVRPNTVGVGDIDSDHRSEVVIPGSVKSVFPRGEKESVYFRIFLNLYKQGKKGLWKTTLHSESDCVWEEKIFWTNEIKLANLDQDPANEIILRTATWLSVFDYVPDRGELKLVSFITPFLENRDFIIRSITAADIDNTGSNEIIVSGNEMEEIDGSKDVKCGWLFVVQARKDELQIIKSVQIDASVSFSSLCVGDLDDDENFEIYTTGCRQVGTRYRTFLLGWDSQGEKIVDFPIPDSDSDMPFLNAPMDIDDLTYEIGDEVLVGIFPNKLFLFTWKDGQIFLKRSYVLESPKAKINNITIGDSDGDRQKEIIIGGFLSEEDAPRFYLEVLGFNNLSSDIYSKWKRIGEKGETEVWSAAIGRK